jgi:C_GCAxxG_C_C family probable redox protein
MTVITKNEEIGDQAKIYFENGYHCAESITASVLEGLGEDAHSAIAHATAFGGGFGKTFEGPCGALSGSLIVIGQLNARKEQGESWDDSAELGARIFNKFIEVQKTMHCKTLRDKFGEEQPQECARLVKQTAVELMEILKSGIIHD